MISLIYTLTHVRKFSHIEIQMEEVTNDIILLLI